MSRLSAGKPYVLYIGSAVHTPFPGQYSILHSLVSTPYSIPWSVLHSLIDASSGLICGGPQAIILSCPFFGEGSGQIIPFGPIVDVHESTQIAAFI